ncbi:hypothetical protein A3H55_00815 [Candidatus Kuenenbacteria bacterium RIFCSPLOWO2_02_FULL_42_16]|uniref:Uncharacterized protein n=1 Tax=Candidatus Kuenenbacteria bacterium RIFCSPLOWO2_02_FULL_42_16 TaxID=1798564 RepID=A0A1F6FWX7_9BACT|nr:MAG: hypothetical protein A3H55_00815 [Candidatus Kuenenbacteria bacterium RIFCSPLOWO2_02_FULL_42_16]
MSKTSRKITKEELVEKVGVENLALVLDNVYCAECGPTAMVEYEDDIVVEPSGDTILHGKCKKCGHKVARLLETGEMK